jgi:hypothetical protein
VNGCHHMVSAINNIVGSDAWLQLFIARWTCRLRSDVSKLPTPANACLLRLLMYAEQVTGTRHHR